MSLLRPFRSFVSAVALLSASVAFAQATRSSKTVPLSKMEIYAGYGYWNPLSSNIDGYKYDEIYNGNVAGSFSYYFRKRLGVTVDGNYLNDNRTETRGVSGLCAADAAGKLRCFKDQAVVTLGAGPVYRWPIGRWVPFAHVMGGAEQANGPVLNPLKWGWMVEGGGGVDYVLPFFHDHLAVRPVQMDYQYGHISYGPLVLPAGINGGAADLGALHLSAGLVFRLGREESEPVTLVCSAEPNLVYPGETVTASAMGKGFGKNPHLNYTWQIPGATKPGHDGAVTIPTTGLAPGDYKVEVSVAERGHRKAQAMCSTGFTIHAFEPPTVGCSVAPEKVAAGEAVTVTASGRSPQNRTLTYTYTASSGKIAGEGSSAKLDTTGVAAGTAVSVGCEVTDDLGKKASATASVAISEPPPPPVVEAAPVAPTAPPEVAKQQVLCTILFERDRKRPVRVDNEAKACLDSVALSKNRETLSKLVLVGTYAHGEPANAGAERALHAKQYLAAEKGIDPNSIQTMVKASEKKSVESVLLPGDAVFEDEGSMEFDPESVKLQGEAYGTHHAAGTPVATGKKKHRKHRKH